MDRTVYSIAEEFQNQNRVLQATASNTWPVIVLTTQLDIYGPCYSAGKAHEPAAEPPKKKPYNSPTLRVLGVRVPSKETEKGREKDQSNEK
jgi:hypothetical protein